MFKFPMRWWKIVASDYPDHYRYYSEAVDKLKSMIDIRPKVFEDFAAIQEKFPCNTKVNEWQQSFVRNFSCLPSQIADPLKNKSIDWPSQFWCISMIFVIFRYPQLLDCMVINPSWMHACNYQKELKWQKTNLTILQERWNQFYHCDYPMILIVVYSIS